MQHGDSAGIGWRNKWRPVIFVAVGVFNTGLFFVLANSLSHLFEFGTTLAAYIAYAVLIPVSFFGHRRLTFNSKGSVPRQWLKFCVIQATNFAIIGVVTGAGGGTPVLAGWVSFAIIGVLIPILNFIVLQLWVFSRRLSAW